MHSDELDAPRLLDDVLRLPLTLRSHFDFHLHFCLVSMFRNVVSSRLLPRFYSSQTTLLRAMSSSSPSSPLSSEQATFNERVAALEKRWKEDDRWKGVVRPYSARDVVSKQGQFPSLPLESLH